MIRYKKYPNGFTVLLLVCLVTSLSYSTKSFATDAGPALEKKHLLKDAVRVQITPKGQKYFDTNLSKVLGNLGINLQEGYFPSQSFQATKNLNLDSYSHSNPEAVKLFNHVRNVLTQWFVGFAVNSPRPGVNIGESGYTAQFSRFGLVTDQELMSRLGKRDGAVLAIELEITKLTLATSTIRAWDSNNENLGQVSLNDVSAQLGSKIKPIKIRLPFYIRINAQGGLDFESLEIAENLSKTDISVKYKKLLLPQIFITVNGKQYAFNQIELEKLMNDQLPKALAEFRSYLGDFAKKQLPELLNQKANQALVGTLEQVQELVPPGKEKNDIRPNFKWGLILSGINLRDSLDISLNAYVEDPISEAVSVVETDLARGLPTNNQLSKEDYDIFLSVDRGMINRVLRLSFQRKNFEKIELKNGTKLTLVSAPLVDFAPISSNNPQETFVKVHVAVENHPNSSFLQETIVVEFDILSKLRQLKSKDKSQDGMQLVLQSIELKSLILDHKYLTMLGSIFAGSVTDGITKELQKISQTWQTEEEIIPGKLPIPPEILGLKLDLRKIQMEPSGHLAMYLNYSKENYVPGAKK